MPDNKKYDSQTISQQRKAREDFLELKKMQSGEITAQEHKKITADTLEEKASNFWYYYRWWVVGIAFLIIVLAICVKQCVSRVNYDLSITIFTSSPVGDDDAKEVAAYFEALCDDVNGDGEVHVQIFNCSFVNGGNRQVLLANNSKVQAIIATENNAMLFITDDDTFEYLNNISKQTKLFEDDGVLLNDDFYSACEVDDLFELPKNLKISRRALKNTVMSKNTTAAECYKASGKLLDKLNKKQ